MIYVVYFTLSKTNKDYWTNKIRRNVERDVVYFPLSIIFFQMKKNYL